MATAMHGTVTQFQAYVSQEGEMTLIINGQETLILAGSGHGPNRPAPKVTFDGKTVDLTDLPKMLMKVSKSKTVVVHYEPDPSDPAATPKADFTTEDPAKA